jgi:hypothetical protein
VAQTATTSLPPLPPPALAWFEPRTGKPTDPFRDWVVAMDRIMRAGLLGTLVNAANDAAAAAAGVPLNGLYRNGSAVQIRVT